MFDLKFTNMLNVAKGVKFKYIYICKETYYNRPVANIGQPVRNYRFFFVIRRGDNCLNKYNEARRWAIFFLMRSVFQRNSRRGKQDFVSEPLSAPPFQ